MWGQDRAGTEAVALGVEESGESVWMVRTAMSPATTRARVAQLLVGPEILRTHGPRLARLTNLDWLLDINAIPPGFISCIQGLIEFTN
jgi:hypothetical protein